MWKTSGQIIYKHNGILSIGSLQNKPLVSLIYIFFFRDQCNRLVVPKWHVQDNHLGVWEVNNTTYIFNLIFKLFFREGMFYVHNITVKHVIYKYTYFGSMYSKYFMDKNMRSREVGDDSASKDRLCSGKK